MPGDREADSENNDLAVLIGRCALRDQRAFLGLYDATSAKLFAVILRILKKEHWAEEVLQDVFLKVWQAADSYNGGRGRPMTWLINIARNRAIDFLRGAEHAAARRADPLDEVGDTPDEGLTAALDPLRAVETGAEMTRLAECLKAITAEARECILMVYHQGYTPTEVSARRNHPIGTVKTWLRRGLQQLRGCMQV